MHGDKNTPQLGPLLCVAGREGRAWGTWQLLLARWVHKNVQWPGFLGRVSTSFLRCLRANEKATTPSSWPLAFWWNPFSAGQLISATTEEIVKAYYPSYFLLSVDGQIQTRQVQGSYDDSYLGDSLTNHNCSDFYSSTSSLFPFHFHNLWNL